MFLSLRSSSIPKIQIIGKLVSLSSGPTLYFLFVFLLSPIKSFKLITKSVLADGESRAMWFIFARRLPESRPGRKAALKHRVRSPLMEAGLTKNEIRELSRRAGLPTADEPASACLSSRFPYGVRITEEKLKLVDQGEEALREMGFRIFRVRHHESLVRLEFGSEDLKRALNPDMASQLSKIFKGLGYKFVTVDLEGYRTGSANEVLTAGEKQKFDV